MAIRIVLNPSGVHALKSLTEKLKKQNPMLSRFQNNLVSHAVVNLNMRVNHARLKTLADILLSRQGKKKMLIKKLKDAFDQGLDEATVLSLENSVNKAVNKTAPIVNIEDSTSVPKGPTYAK